MAGLPLDGTNDAARELSDVDEGLRFAGRTLKSLGEAQGQDRGELSVSGRCLRVTTSVTSPPLKQEAAGEEEVIMKLRRQVHLRLSPSLVGGLTRVRFRLNLQLERRPEAQNSSTFDLAIDPARRHETFRLTTIGRVGWTAPPAIS